MREGGRYKRDTKGGVTKVDGTQPHPDGNRPRGADGTPLDVPAPAPATKAPAPKGDAEAERSDRG